MQTLHTDVAIIGAGSAGMSAYRAALAHTKKVVVIEGGAYGTTCARVGCMPSKLLIAAAEAAHAISHASAFGVQAGALRVDGAAVMQRLRSERDRFVGFVVDAVEHWPAEHRLRGRARFVGDGLLQVDGQTRIEAGRIVIATGSRPALPEGWRQRLGRRLIVNDDVFGWHTLPRSVAVVGAGAIGLEIAQALHRLGVRVRLYSHSDRIGPLTDPALQAVAREVFAGELPLTLCAQLDPVLDGDRDGHRSGNRSGNRSGSHDGNPDASRDSDPVGVRVRATLADGRTEEEHFDWLLAATGRRPNVDALGLETTSLPLDPSGVPVFDRRTGQVGVQPVFMAGDVQDERMLLHEAADEGRIAGDNAGRFPEVRVRPRRAPLAVVFSDPQIAVAGAGHAELSRAGRAFASGAVSFSDQGRSRVMLKNRGALRVYAEQGSGRFLGAEMIGPAAEHLGHLLAWSVQRGDSVQQMIDSPFYHPVVEEGLRTALRDLQYALKLGPMPVERCLDCGPGS